MRIPLALLVIELAYGSIQITNKNFWKAKDQASEMEWIVALKDPTIKKSDVLTRLKDIKTRLNTIGFPVHKMFKLNFGDEDEGAVTVKASPKRMLALAALASQFKNASDFFKSNIGHIEPVLPIRSTGDVTTQRLKSAELWGLDALAPGLDAKYKYDRTGKNVEAYIFDSGIQVNHKEFKRDDGTSRAFSFFNAIPNEADTDLNGHGTHVAGIVGGNTYGVAKGALLKGVKVLDAEGNGNSAYLLDGLAAVVQSLEERINNGEEINGVVINMSLGGPPSKFFNNLLTKLALWNVPIVVAAGNEDEDACESSPASSKGALTVGAVSVDGKRASFSNWGECVDIMAPGVNILSAYMDSKGKGDSTRIVSGTSQASPHAAGLVALLLESSPKKTVSDLKALLAEWSVSNLQTDTLKGAPNLFVTSPHTGEDTRSELKWASSSTSYKAKRTALSVLAGGIIAAIVFAVLAALFLVGYAIWNCHKKKEAAKEQKLEPVPELKLEDPDEDPPIR